MDNSTPHSLIRKRIGAVNRSASFGLSHDNKGTVSRYMIERKLIKGLKGMVNNRTAPLPKMKGMGWPLIEEKIIGSNQTVQSESYQLLQEGKPYQAIVHLFPNLQS